MATFVRPADAYRARHRASPGDAERALAELSLRDERVASASLGGLPDDLWRRICAFVRPASAHELIVAAGSSASLRHALQAEVEQTERDVFDMTRGEAEQILRSEGYLFPGSSISKAFLRVLSDKTVFPDGPAATRRDLRDDDGATLRLARAFLAYGVDPDYARRSTGKTALMLTPELACAGWEDAEALAVLLLSSGADVHATCNHGFTPLVYAFRSLQMNKNRLDFPSYRDSGAFCVGVTFYLMVVSLSMTRRSLRANWSLYRDPEANFAAMQAGLLSQEEKFMACHGHGLQGFCEITVEYLRVWEIDPLVLNFHYMTKVVTRIGLDREAVGEPEDGERALAFADRSKQMTFLAQDCVRELCAAGSLEFAS